MKKKILLVSILAVFILLSISYASAVNTNSIKNNEKKESPLFTIRIRRAIGEKIGNIISNVKARFLGDRIFFRPIQFLLNLGSREPTNMKTDPYCTMCGEPCT